MKYPVWTSVPTITLPDGKKSQAIGVDYHSLPHNTVNTQECRYQGHNGILLGTIHRKRDVLIIQAKAWTDPHYNWSAWNFTPESPIGEEMAKYWANPVDTNRAYKDLNWCFYKAVVGAPDFDWQK